jgi:hypothetical protein
MSNRNFIFMIILRRQGFLETASGEKLNELAEAEGCNRYRICVCLLRRGADPD